MEGMLARSVAADVISYSATISACEKGQQWQLALQLMEGMPARSVAADVISYNAALRGTAVCTDRI